MTVTKFRKFKKSDTDTVINLWKTCKLVVPWNDPLKDINRKLNKAWCPEKQAKENPVLEYCKCIVFEKYDQFDINRPEKFGGNVSYESYKKLEDAFVNGDIHPMDLKQSTAFYINELIKPVREHFENDHKAKKLKEQVESFKVTR